MMGRKVGNERRPMIDDHRSRQLARVASRKFRSDGTALLQDRGDCTSGGTFVVSNLIIPRRACLECDLRDKHVMQGPSKIP